MCIYITDELERKDKIQPLNIIRCFNNNNDVQHDFTGIIFLFIEECCCPMPYKHHPFPEDVDMKKRWTQLINRRTSDGQLWQPSRSSRVCSVHFIDGEPTSTNPLPTLFLGHLPTGSKLSTPRRKLVKHGPSSENSDNPIPGTTELSSESASNMDEVDSESHSSVTIKYELTNRNFPVYGARIIGKQQGHTAAGKSSDVVHYLRLKERLKQLEPFLKPLYKKLLTSNHAAHFYTNLPTLDTFNILCKYVKRYEMNIKKSTKSGRQTTLTKYWNLRSSARNQKLIQQILCVEDRILMTLMKLRLDLLHRDLADRYIFLYYCCLLLSA